MNASKPIKLQDIADRAGVCRATVSLALRNHPSLPVLTRTRIQDLAKELGYRPNPLVAALMTYKRALRCAEPTGTTIAFVVNFSRRGPWRSYLTRELITGAAAVAERNGYNLEEFWIKDLGVTGQRFSNILDQRGIRGVIIAPLPAAHGHLRLDWPQFSIVAIGYSLVRPEFHRVSTHRYQSMLMAVRHLRRAGYRKLGLAIDANQDARVDRQWSAAFHCDQLQVKPDHQTDLFLARSQDWTEHNFGRWFGKNSPEVVLGYDPIIVTWLKKLGKRVPEDVGFVHLWNPDRSGQYAGLYHSPLSIGGAAAEQVISLLQRNETGIPAEPHTLLLNAAWLDGASLSVLRTPPNGTS